MNILRNKDLEMLEKKILQHNSITSARYDYSKCQLDILFSILSQLKENKLDYVIHLQYIEELTGNRWNSKYLDDATDEIGQKIMKIYNIDDGNWQKVWFFQHVKYFKNSRILELKLSESITPYLFELKNNFTSLELYSVLKCSSKFAKRIYGLCCQWRNIGEIEYDIKELKLTLGLINDDGKEQFTRISDFKKKVLEVSKNQINDFTDVKFDYELKKSYGSRSFDKVLFKIKKSISKIPKNGDQMPIAYDSDLEYQRSYTFLQLNYNSFFTDSQKEELASKKTKEELEKIFNEIQKKIQKTEVRNIKGFVIDCLQREKLLYKTQNV